MYWCSRQLAIGFIFAMAVYLVISDTAHARVVEVSAQRFFNDTGFTAAPATGQTFRIRAVGSADLSSLNGSYITDPDGTIQFTPDPASGAFEFFRDRARPIGVPPTAGTRKLFEPLSSSLPGHLPGAPYGALVAGFSLSDTPTSFDDFPAGFQLVGSFAEIAAPAEGGRLFLGVNDFNNPGGDNAGSYFAQVVPVPAALPLLATGLGLLAWARRQRERS